MPARTASSESDSSVMEPSSIRSNSTASNANRWRINSSGQFVDSEAATEWDLSDQLVRLKIGEDGIRGQTTTPPKARGSTAGMAHLNEASPLDTSSDASANSSPQPTSHQPGVTHSRGSSADTTSSTRSSGGQKLSASSQLKVNTGGEGKERPHSFSGGLSAADLRRLQQAGEVPDVTQNQQWTSAQLRDAMGVNADQPSYPSITNPAAFARSQPQQYESRSSQSPASVTQAGNPDDFLMEYHLQRNFSPLPQQGIGANVAGIPPPFTGRPNNLNNMSYRQPPRGFPPQAMPGPGYPVGHHTPHLSLGNAQQLYDMMHNSMLPDNQHPAVARVQQQHNVYRPTHQHSASDPSAMRDAATLALLNSNMQPFAPYPAPPPQPMPLYPNQFYGAQDIYPRTADLVAAQALANRLQPQYTGYGSDDANTSGPGGSGPSANNRKLGLYKTELCRSWEEKGSCRYGAKCQFAHGEDELRKVARHPKYKTEICRTFWVSGSCPYGKRCCFIHTELPASGAPPGADGAPPPPVVDGRARSMSTNSDPNEQSVSLLARISAKRKEESSGSSSQSASTPVDPTTPTTAYQLDRRPPTGSLRVDTSVLDNSAGKQNKSAYPTFASNVIAPSNEQTSLKSPIPVTAGPDLGRHNNARLEIVGYNQTRMSKPSSTSPNVRHSFNGTEVSLEEYSTPTSTVSGQPALRMASPDRNVNGVTMPRANGHARSGSAGNWGSFSRSSLATSYPQSSGAGGELRANTPWSTSELTLGSSRLNEKAWA